MFGFIVGLAVLFLSECGPFLAQTQRSPAQVLVIEAWIWDRYNFQDALDEFHRGAYQRLILVGEPVLHHDGSAGPSEAELAANRLRELGCSDDLLEVLKMPVLNKNRTYTTALHVRDWVRQHEPTTTGLNVITVGVHARKSRLLFQEAFGPKIRVGIIAGVQNRYSLHWWWLSRTGIELVLRNVVGYLYYGYLWSPPQENRL